MVSDGLYFKAGWQQAGIGFRNNHLALATKCSLPCSASRWLSHSPSGQRNRTGFRDRPPPAGEAEVPDAHGESRVEQRLS